MRIQDIKEIKTQHTIITGDPFVAPAKWTVNILFDNIVLDKQQIKELMDMLNRFNLIELEKRIDF